MTFGINFTAQELLFTNSIKVVLPCSRNISKHNKLRLSRRQFPVRQQYMLSQICENRLCVSRFVVLQNPSLVSVRPVSLSYKNPSLVSVCLVSLSYKNPPLVSVCFVSLSYKNPSWFVIVECRIKIDFLEKLSVFLCIFLVGHTLCPRYWWQTYRQRSRTAPSGTRRGTIFNGPGWDLYHRLPPRRFLLLFDQ